MLCCSCRQLPEATFNYQQLNYNHSLIQIFHSDSAKNVLHEKSKPLPLSNNDLITIDTLFKNAVKAYNDSLSRRLPEMAHFTNPPLKDPAAFFLINLEEYRFEYYPHINENEHPVVKVIARCIPEKCPVSNMLGNKAGRCTVELTIRIDEKVILFELHTQGFCQVTYWVYSKFC
jgi:hypothetical protein